LLAVPEDQWFDRKSAPIAPRDLGPPLAAFANADGGTLVIGLHDGKVEGCRQYKDKVNPFRRLPSTSPYRRPW
jgi:ATP-dependent DNA helicase RecG